MSTTNLTARDAVLVEQLKRDHTTSRARHSEGRDASKDAALAAWKLHHQQGWTLDEIAGELGITKTGAFKLVAKGKPEAVAQGLTAGNPGAPEASEADTPDSDR